MKKNVNLKPSQEYTNVSITLHNLILFKKIKHSKNYILISIFFIKYSLSYKHISRGHVRRTLYVPNGYAVYVHTDTL